LHDKFEAERSFLTKLPPSITAAGTLLPEIAARQTQFVIPDASSGII
jgi:hypothetical protein